MSEPFFKLLSPEVTKWCRQVDNIKKSESDEVTGLYTYDVNPDVDFASSQSRDQHVGEMAFENRKFSRRGRRATKENSHIKQARKHTLMKGGQNDLISSRSLGASNNALGEQTSPTGAQKKLSMSRTGTAEVSVTAHGPHKVRPSMLMTDQGHHHQAHVESNHTTLGEAPEIILDEFTVNIWETDEDLVAMRSHINDLIRNSFAGGMQYFIEGDWKMATAKFNHVLNITNGRDGPSINILRHINDDYGGECPADWKGYRDMS